jgi:putative ABC transport system permease protein
MVDWAIPLQTGDSYRGFPVVATSGALFTRFQPVAGEPMAVREGRFFESPLDAALLMQEPLVLRYRSAIKQAVVGEEAARGAGLALGDRILMTHGTGEHADHVHMEDAIEVVGILQPTGTAHDRAIFIDLGTGWLLHARDFHEKMAGEYQAAVARARQAGEPLPPAFPALDQYFSGQYVPQITGIYMRAATRPGSETSSVLPSLLATLRANQLVSAVASPTDQIQGLFRIVGNINQILVGMAAVVMVSSGIAIMLALYNSMEQRRRQIAVLRVLGASRVRIFGLIVTESALLGVIGSFVGLALAWGGGLVVSGVMRDRLGLAIDPSLWITQEVGESRWDLPLTPLVVLGTVVLAAAAGVVPAVMAYRTSVARNLRPLG